MNQTPYLSRQGKPTFLCDRDDCTDLWKQAPAIVLQHGLGHSLQL